MCRSLDITASAGPSISIGASGSISGVTGAFLALFPRVGVKIISIFGFFIMPAKWLLLLFFALDLLRHTMSIFGRADDSIAYMAHIAGYVFGFSLAFSLLAFKILRREEFDIWFILVQSRRRAQFRRAQQQTKGAMWDTRACFRCLTPLALAPRGTRCIASCSACARICMGRWSIVMALGRALLAS